MTLLLELCGRKGAGDSNATEPLSTAASPSHASYLHHNSVCFHYSYFMWYPDMKEELFPSRWRAGYDWLSGRKAPNKMERRVLGGGWCCEVEWGGGVGFTRFKASKQAAQTEEIFPLRV